MKKGQGNSGGWGVRGLRAGHKEVLIVSHLSRLKTQLKLATCRPKYPLTVTNDTSKAATTAKTKREGEGGRERKRGRGTLDCACVIPIKCFVFQRFHFLWENKKAAK